jgi:hypothetical protein
VTRLIGLLSCVATLTLVAACGLQSTAAAPEHPTARSNSETSSQLRAGQYQELERRYSAVQMEFENGKISGDDLRAQFREFYPTDPDLGPKLDSWAAQYPSSYVARVARGIYYKKVGLRHAAPPTSETRAKARLTG